MVGAHLETSDDGVGRTYGLEHVGIGKELRGGIVPTTHLVAVGKEERVVRHVGDGGCGSSQRACSHGSDFCSAVIAKYGLGSIEVILPE